MPFRMGGMVFDAYIFDLDGTLLDTLPDLVNLTNEVLAGYGWPARTRDEILSFVGNGGRVLLERAAPSGTPAAELDAAFARWRELYPTLGHALTRPYPGIPEVLAELESRGARLAVLSNKFDAAAREVIAEHFPGTFDLVRGEALDIPRKPDPTGLLKLVDLLGVSPSRTLYIGDSATDIEVARRANVPSVGVTWGYQSAATLKAAGADALVDTPGDLLRQPETT